jgi:anti-sigma B factor antagonist
MGKPNMTDNGREPKILVDRWGDRALWLVVASGEHDLSTIPKLDNALAKIREHGPEAILDFSDATFVDSATVLAIMRHAQTPGESTVVVAAPGTAPRRTFDLVFLNSTVPVCDSRDEALGRLGR